MDNELIVCAAAFFQNKGRDVIAEKEFTMGVSLDYRWMSVNEAKSLINAMVSAGILESKGGYLRPKFKGSEISVPIAYRPSAKLIASVTSMKKEPVTMKKEQGDNVFSEMISMAEKAGMRRAGYIAACNSIQKKLDIDIEVAGVMILRDIGADVSSLYERVRDSVLSK